MTDMMGKEPLFAAEQIRIPPELPDILKTYTKFIIRNQPSDILAVSAEYFSRLAKQRTTVGKKITTMQLDAFYRKFSNMDRPSVHRKEIEEACLAGSITITQLNDIISLGGWQGEKIPWIKFWALLAASASGTFQATIETVALVLGDNGSVPSQPITEVVQFLSDRDTDVDKNAVSGILSGLQTAGPKIKAEVLNDLIRQRPQAQAPRVEKASVTSDDGGVKGDPGADETMEAEDTVDAGAAEEPIQE